MLASSKKKLKAFFPQSQTSPNHLQVLTDKDEPYIPSSNNKKTFNNKGNFKYLVIIAIIAVAFIYFGQNKTK